jgi:hypothetical protein
MAFFKAMCAAQRNALPSLEVVDPSLLVGTIRGSTHKENGVVPISIKY